MGHLLESRITADDIDMTATNPCNPLDFVTLPVFNV
jgi:hypothetical protein